jgi:branched-chain amino acid aminotransferase
VITVARDLGYEVEVRILTLQDLLTADEAFFTGTAVEVTPIRELDGKKIGEGKRGPVTEEIQRSFLAAVTGQDRRYSEWLQPVATRSAVSFM